MSEDDNGEKEAPVKENQSKRTPNDPRRDAHNPTAPEYKSAMDRHSDQPNPTSTTYKATMANRSNQLNPQHPAFQKSRGKK